METSPCHWRLALHTRGRCTQRSIALLGRVAATACSLFVRGSRRSSAKEGEESYRKERERGLPACVSPVTPPTRDTCRIFSCANITCSALANIILKYRECKPERAGDEPISRYSKFLENLLRGPLRAAQRSESRSQYVHHLCDRSQLSDFVFERPCAYLSVTI